MTEDVKQNVPGSIAELAPRMELQGKVKRIELYGAFVDVGVGTDALLHISQLGKPNVKNVSDVLKVDEQITVYVLKVDAPAERIALSMVLPPEHSWDAIREGAQVTGKVVRVESYGAFIDIGAERPAMVHVSELADSYVKSASDVVQVGQEVTGHIIKLDRKARKIDMSLKTQVEAVAYEPEVVEEGPAPTVFEMAFRHMSDDDDRGRRDKQRKRDDRDRRRREQDDIIERTLRGHSN
jgi:predicted RNA-binding protein with RPS1 domain